MGTGSSHYNHEDFISGIRNKETQNQAFGQDFGGSLPLTSGRIDKIRYDNTYICLFHPLPVLKVILSSQLNVIIAISKPNAEAPINASKIAFFFIVLTNCYLLIDGSDMSSMQPALDMRWIDIELRGRTTTNMDNVSQDL